MTKVLLIGLDGEGYEAIRDYDIIELKQKTFGAVTSEEIDLKTPPIWSSLICGVKDTGVYDFPKDNTRMGAGSQHESSLLDELEETEQDDPYCDGGIGNRREELNVDPWIENYEYEVVNFPIYNYNNYFDGVGDYQLYWGARFLDGDISPKELVKKFSKESKDILERTYRKIGDNDIVLSYIHDTDYICHLTYMHYKLKKPVLSYWTIVSHQIRQLKRNIDSDILVLLLSDHGSSIGDVSYSTPDGHSPLGFYSFNKEVNVPDSIHITEFKDILEEWL